MTVPPAFTLQLPSVSGVEPCQGASSEGSGMSTTGFRHKPLAPYNVYTPKTLCPFRAKVLCALT